VSLAVANPPADRPMAAGLVPALGALVIGECLVDLAPEPPTGPDRHGAQQGRVETEALRFVAFPGGSPANVAVGLARLGVPSYFGGRLSRVAFGPVLREHLARNAVDLRHAVDAAEPPTLAVVTLDDRGRASYVFYGPESADWQWSLEQLPFENGARAGPAPAELGLAVVHTGSLLTVFEPAATVIPSWLRRVRQRGDVVTSFDPNVRVTLVSDADAYRARVENLVSSSHIVKASSEDMAGIYRPGPGTLADGEALKSSFVERTAEHWLGLGAHLVVVTAGEEGAAAFHSRGWRAQEHPPAIEVKDTIGAGDAVTSTLLAYLYARSLLAPDAVADLGEEDMREALHQGVAASAFTCTRWGADPPRSVELAQYLAALTGQR